MIIKKLLEKVKNRRVDKIIQFFYGFVIITIPNQLFLESETGSFNRPAIFFI